MANIAATVVIAPKATVAPLYPLQKAGRDWMEDYLTPQQSTK
jgi:hypothetical protein